MTSENVVDPLASTDERAAESALRPTSLSDFVGQDRVKQQLNIVLQAAKYG